jgi:hypothetical protein
MPLMLVARCATDERIDSGRMTVLLAGYEKISIGTGYLIQ